MGFNGVFYSLKANLIYCMVMVASLCPTLGALSLRDSSVIYWVYYDMDYIRMGGKDMTDEYEVTLVVEVTTTVTLAAESEEDAIEAAYDQFIVEVALANKIETVELIEYTVTKNENKIH